jgi:hypothetical protein
MKLEQAYPAIAFRWRTRNWWARLTRTPPECIHLENDVSWMATFIPDTLYLSGKASVLRRPARPEISLCRACLLGELEIALARYPGRVLAFEPDGDSFSQYFFVAQSDFSPAGLEPQTAAAITRRIEQSWGECERCSSTDVGGGAGAGEGQRAANWLWISREEVGNLDEAGRIGMARGESLCPEHGARKLCEALAGLPEANIFYVNVPYGDAGAYLWI